MIKKRILMFMFGSLASFAVADFAKPNILLILADDLGYGDVQCYNPERGKIPTPNIDRLAAQGMRFTDGHSAAGGCTPSRYALLTGRYDWRSRSQRGVFGGFGGPALIQPERLTIAGLAKTNGYRTACIGKWHVGWNWPIPPKDYQYLGVKSLQTIIQESEAAGHARNPSIEELAVAGFYGVKPVAGYQAPVPTAEQLDAWRRIFSQPVGGGPTAIGFDYFFGCDAPGYPPFAYMENDRLLDIPTEFLSEKHFLPSVHLAACQGPAVKGWDFNAVAQRILKRANAYIAEAAKAKKPFLLHLPLLGPHQPWAVSESWKNKSGLNLYADNVMETDAAIGELLATLEQAGVADNTLVIVTSDNGYSPYGVGEMLKKGHHSSGPFHGYKAQANEGGHRVPFIVRWPGVVKPGGVCGRLVNQVDLLATFAEILGVKLPDNAGEDSFSFLPLLKGQDSPGREEVVNHSGQGGYGIRKGDWKLILEADKPIEPQLFNLAQDIGETKNLAAQYPERVAELRALMAKLVADGRSTPGPKQQNDTKVLWEPKLNVIFFLMDDLGWNDLGFTGSKFFESPNIDRLAAQGVVFTRAYAACICSPSRASIITGLDPARTGLTMPRGGDPLEVLKAHVQPRIYTPEEIRDNWRNLPGGMQAPPNQRAMSVVSASRLSTEYPSLAKVFKAAGYRTAHFGKWHVGPEPYSPIEHGFDVDVPHVNSAGPMGRHFGPWREWVEESSPKSKDRQIDDVLADHAIKFIQENKGRPFYMNFWTYGVHVPIQAREETIAYFKAKAPKTGQNNPVYAAMIKHTDDAIGRVWKAVEEAGLAQKTVIVFYSDNGGVNYGTPQITDNSPLRGGKGNIYEGGVRVPAFFVWPGVAKAGTTCDLPINTRDFFPTLAEICGVKGLPKFDGRSVAPALTGKPMEAKPIFTHYPHYTGNWGNGGAPATTVVSEGWKLFRVYYDGPGQTDRFELYNLKDDPGETLDYHRQRPELVAKLNGLIEAFVKATGAVLPIPNPDYKGAVKGEFEGLAYELLEPVVRRGARWPLVVCLEGEGNPAYVELHKTSIQNRNGTFLLAVKSHEKVAGLIAKLLQDYPIQARQVYVTGQGIGAVAAWELAARHPGLFAAVLPVGGAGVPEQAAALKDMPVWAFGGAHDPAAAATRAAITALKAAGSTVAKHTEYSQNEQVLLDNVWGNQEMHAWLFAQSSPVGKPGPRK